VIRLGYDDPDVARWCKEMGAIGGQTGEAVYALFSDRGVWFSRRADGELIAHGIALKQGLDGDPSDQRSVTPFSGQP
jgi:hypothetical protein